MSVEDAVNGGNRHVIAHKHRRSDVKINRKKGGERHKAKDNPRKKEGGGADYPDKYKLMS